MENYFVVDLGGTNVKYGLATQSGELSFQGQFKTPPTLEELLQSLFISYKDLLKNGEIAGVAVSSPGAVDAQNGVVYGTSAISYIHEIPFTKYISQKLDNLPISIENDANSAILGEVWKGNAKGMYSAVAIVCGSGIGGGVFLNGEIMRGAHFLGGEFGYMPMFSRKGDLKTWSDFTIVNATKTYAAQTGERIDGYTLAERCRAGEPLVQALMEDFFLHTAMGVVTVQYYYDPEIILLGGALSKDDWIISNIKKSIEIISVGQDFDVHRPNFGACANGNDANLLGALYRFLIKYDLPIGE